MRRLADAVGFVGRVEYRHLFSQSGGAQFGHGVGDHGDRLTVFAEAFERDANPGDFSLTAIIAHERGHQLLVRHPRLSKWLDDVTPAAEEVVASLLGALVLGIGKDQDALLAKATAELIDGGAEPVGAVRLVGDLCDALRQLL